MRIRKSPAARRAEFVVAATVAPTAFGGMGNAGHGTPLPADRSGATPARSLARPFAHAK
ncbi:hypothetical protein ACIBKX_15285 [Streptomyces sp. NPDC050658]|uniref:hypothetical protein n=1 Tax=unclassified Streptomyces TaxID=2593676 RepID=UPI0034478CAE